MWPVRHEVLRTVFPALDGAAVCAGPGSRRGELGTGCQDRGRPGRPGRPDRGGGRAAVRPCGRRAAAGPAAAGSRVGARAGGSPASHRGGRLVDQATGAGSVGRRYAYQCRGGRRTAPLPVQYADYTLWQRELLGEEDDPDSLAKVGPGERTGAGVLAGARRRNCSCRRTGPRSAVPSPTAGSPRSCGFPRSHQEHGQRLLGLARVRRVTMFMVIHAALAVLLSRLGVYDDIAVGTPVAGLALMWRWDELWSGCSLTRWCCAPIRPATRVTRGAAGGCGSAGLGA